MGEERKEGRQGKQKEWRKEGRENRQKEGRREGTFYRERPTRSESNARAWVEGRKDRRKEGRTEGRKEGNKEEKETRKEGWIHQHRHEYAIIFSPFVPYTSTATLSTPINTDKTTAITPTSRSALRG